MFVDNVFLKDDRKKAISSAKSPRLVEVDDVDVAVDMEADADEFDDDELLL